jgi:hypothetical protein
LSIIHHRGWGWSWGRGKWIIAREQGRVHVVEHQNLWEQLVLESALHEDHDDSGGYLKCGCYIPISGLQFEHVEGYLEEFLTYNVLNVDINKKKINLILHIHLEKSNMLGFKDEDSLKVLTLNQAVKRKSEISVNNGS